MEFNGTYMKATLIFFSYNIVLNVINDNKDIELMPIKDCG